MGWLLGRSVVFQHTTFFIPPVIIKIIPNIFNRRILVNPSITTNPDQWPVIILKVIIKTIPNFFNCQFIKYWLTLSPLTIGMMCELISDCQFWSYIKVFFLSLLHFFITFVITSRCYLFIITPQSTFWTQVNKLQFGETQKSKSKSNMLISGRPLLLGERLGRRSREISWSCIRSSHWFLFLSFGISLNEKTKNLNV